jgi:serine/threonine-protein kinase
MSVEPSDSPSGPPPDGSAANADDEPRAPKAGDLIGAYRLVRLSGYGASGWVFEVEHEKIARRAAMKILSPEYAARRGALRRMLSEAQAVNRINHPHIVEITDVIEATEPGGFNGIVMELLEGQSLAQALVSQGRMPPERFVPILAQVADALAAAHAARFVHRDLKPDNIFLTSQAGRADYAKLLDFGLAKAVSPDTSSPGAEPAAGYPRHGTVEGMFLGTPAYASPEQASTKPVDHRTDIYSLGVILYELLCGRLPFEGHNMGHFLVKHITMAPPPAPPDVLATEEGRVLDRVARRCLQKDPAARFSSAGELKRIFEALMRGELPEVADPGANTGDPQVVAPIRKRPVVPAVVAALAIAGIAGWLVLARRGGESRPAGTAQAPAGAALAPPPGAQPDKRAKPEKITLKFESTPSGAETRRAGTGDLLGLTPFFQSFSADGAGVTFEMTLPGHQPRRFDVTLTADAVVGGALQKLPPPGRAATARKPAPAAASRKPANREGTVNPFGR